jgi:hypothetical protein
MIDRQREQACHAEPCQRAATDPSKRSAIPHVGRSGHSLCPRNEPATRFNTIDGRERRHVWMLCGPASGAFLDEAATRTFPHGKELAHNEGLWTANKSPIEVAVLTLHGGFHARGHR